MSGGPTGNLFGGTGTVVAECRGALEPAAEAFVKIGIPDILRHFAYRDSYLGIRP